MERYYWQYERDVIRAYDRKKGSYPDQVIGQFTEPYYADIFVNMLNSKKDN